VETPITSEVRRLRERLNLCKGHWPRIADEASVSHSWLSQFAREVITNPTIDTLKRVGTAVDGVLSEGDPKAA